MWGWGFRALGSGFRVQGLRCCLMVPELGPHPLIVVNWEAKNIHGNLPNIWETPV